MMLSGTVSVTLTTKPDLQIMGVVEMCYLELTREEQSYERFIASEQINVETCMEDFQRTRQTYFKLQTYTALSFCSYNLM